MDRRPEHGWIEIKDPQRKRYYYYKHAPVAEYRWITPSPIVFRPVHDLHDALEQKMTCIMCRTKDVANGSKEDIERLRGWVKKGKAWAMSMLADSYKNGVGVKQSDKKAIELLVSNFLLNYFYQCDGFPFVILKILLILNVKSQWHPLLLLHHHHHSKYQSVLTSLLHGWKSLYISLRI